MDKAVACSSTMDCYQRVLRVITPQPCRCRCRELFGNSAKAKQLLFISFLSNAFFSSSSSEQLVRRFKPSIFLFIHSQIGLGLRVIWAGECTLQMLPSCTQLPVLGKTGTGKNRLNAGDCAAVLKKENCKGLRVNHAHVEFKALLFFWDRNRVKEFITCSR